MRLQPVMKTSPIFHDKLKVISHDNFIKAGRSILSAMPDINERDVKDTTLSLSNIIFT